MPHDVSLISTLAAAMGFALVGGYLAARIGLPPLVGYLVAGIAIGPYTPGFVGDAALAGQLAEIGVMLLMFGVGLHFSLDDLMRVRRIAVPGAIVQIAVATVLGAAVAVAWGWSPGAALVFGLALSVASTVVLLRALEARGRLDSMEGRIAVGWLVVEDLVMVLVLVLLPAASGLLGGRADDAASGSALQQAVASATGLPPLWTALLTTIAKVIAFVAVMLIAGKRLLPWVMWAVARTGSRELFTLCVIAAAIGVAVGSALLFDVSFALGAFFAGTLLRESALAHRAAEESLPLRDAFSVLFFVSVGMLFDPGVLVQAPWQVLGTVAIVMVGKTVAAIALVMAFRYPPRIALTVGASLAQIGEFSFILAGLGVALDLLPEQGRSLVLAGALASIALNVVLFRAIDPVLGWLESTGRIARAQAEDPLLALPDDTAATLLAGQVVVVGYGRVGRRLHEQLAHRGVPVVVVEANREAVEALRARGVAAVSGDAAEPVVLVQAHVARARLLALAIDDVPRARRVVELARMLNPSIELLVRTHSLDEADLLTGQGVSRVFVGEHELADGMARAAIERLGGADTLGPSMPGEATARPDAPSQTSDGIGTAPRPQA